MKRKLRRSFPLVRLVEDFSDRLVAVDLPGLPEERRHETIAFAGRRVAVLPSPMRLGVSLVALAVAVAGRLAGRRRIARVLATRSVPALGDYVRLVRSLTYAYVWDTWPATAADGTPR